MHRGVVRSPSTAHRVASLFATCLLAAAAVAPANAQRVLEVASGLVDLELDAPAAHESKITAEDRARMLAEIAEDARRRVAALGAARGDADGRRLRIAAFALRDAAMHRARSLCRRELHGSAVLAPELGTAVLHLADDLRGAGGRTGAIANLAARLAFAQLLSEEEVDRLGYGFLVSGLAHQESQRVGNSRLHAVVRGVLRPPFVCNRGDPLDRCRSVLAVEAPPSLGTLFAFEESDFDPDQHAMAFAVVAWLQHAAAAPRTGPLASAEIPPLEALLSRARTGEPATTALAAVLTSDLADLDDRFRRFVRNQRRSPDALVSRRRAPVRIRKAHPHAALFAYVREPVPERHRAVVAAALASRSAALTSGFAQHEGRPQLRIGPVNESVFFWSGDERGKSIDRAWPFVVVLEYEHGGEPEAVLECFRRVRGRKDDAGWMLDPTVGFVEHHNAQIATARDERFAYLAIPDTPTGTRIAESEFVHRARVRWKDGSEAVLGVRTLLEARRSATTVGFGAEVEPLVDWTVVLDSGVRGVVGTSVLEDSKRQLAPFATTRVFELPEVPPGLKTGR